jgi:O-antigen ligase
VQTRHLFPYAALLLLAWGAFAFGAEFTWAYAPLLVFSIAVAVLGWLARPAASYGYRGIAIAFAIVIAGAVAQTIPLPASTVKTISPARDAVDYSKLFAQVTMRDEPAALGADAPRPISIAADRSWLGIAFLTALALLLLGDAYGLSGVGTRTVVRGIIVLGAIGAFAEIFQKASGSSIIYGLFTPRQLFYTTAPFVNRNHNAGWLIMTMAVALGHLAGSIAKHGPRKPGWRERILWLQSREASGVILTAFVIGVIAIAVITTVSRSGSICLVIVTLLFGGWSIRRQSTGLRRAFAATYVIAVLLVAMVMGGYGALEERFNTISEDNPDARVGIWRDTATIIRDFPLVGTGLNTYGIAMLKYQTLDDRVRYIEAHNDYLQAAAEGGIMLGIPALALAVAVIVEIRRRFREKRDDTRTHWLRIGSVCGLAAIAFQSIFDFTLQMPGAAVMFMMLVALAIHHPHQQPAR